MARVVLSGASFISQFCRFGEIIATYDEKSQKKI
jgi:hypothetical protein